MPANMILNWYIDVNNPGGSNALLDGEGSATLSQSVRVLQADCFVLRCYFRAKSAAIGGASTTSMPPAGSVIMLAGRLPTDSGAGAALFEAGPFTIDSGGTPAYYQAMLDLSTNEIVAAFQSAGSSVATLNVNVDIEVQNSDNSQRLSYRVPVILCRQAYVGTTPAPAAASATVLHLRSPTGYVWKISVDDDGQLSSERVS